MRITNGLLVFLLAFLGAGGCESDSGGVKKEDSKMLTIRWQRLVDESGQTCERCGLTEKEVQKAFQSLQRSLAPLGIEVALETRALNPATCTKDVSQSNRIWLGGRALEDWLGAAVGKSPCAPCCEALGETVECRTLQVGGETYEAIPAALIVRAGLLAASDLLGAPGNAPCCPGVTGPNTPVCPPTSCGGKVRPQSPSSECCPGPAGAPRNPK